MGRTPRVSRIPLDITKKGRQSKMEHKTRPKRKPLAYQFLIVLTGTDPLVWRRIQAPERYTFWDLHVAIQDAMGWLDSHLHQFTLVDPKTGQLEYIGIPDEDGFSEHPCRAGWKVKISKYFGYVSMPVRYLYDFGDHWGFLNAPGLKNSVIPQIAAGWL